MQRVVVVVVEGLERLEGTEGIEAKANARALTGCWSISLGRERIKISRFTP